MSIPTIRLRAWSSLVAALAIASLPLHGQEANAIAHDRPAAGTAARPSGGGSTAAPTTPFKTVTLPNGLQIVAIEDHGVPLVTVDITVRNGAFTEPDEFAGLSHLYEHMFFKANRANPSQTAFMRKVRNLGISFNGYTSDEVVTYFFTLPSKNLDSGMRFMADAIQSPLFDSTELIREREVVLGEFDRNEAQPDFALGYALDSALWSPYVSRKQPLGQRQVIKTATVEKMRMIQNRFYVPNNAALIVSGDIHPAEIFALARKYFADWQRGGNPFPAYNPPSFPPLRSQIVMREARLPFVEGSLNFHGPSVEKDDPAPFQAELLTTLLSEKNSRLSRRLVDSGLAISFSSNYEADRNTGPFSFDFRSNQKDTRRVIEIIKEETRAMARPGYFTPEEIAIAKKIVADRPIYDRDNVFSFTISPVASWWSKASLGYYTAFPANVEKVTPEDLAGFVTRYLVGQPFVVGVGADHNALAGITIPQEILQW